MRVIRDFVGQSYPRGMGSRQADVTVASVVEASGAGIEARIEVNFLMCIDPVRSKNGIVALESDGVAKNLLPYPGPRKGHTVAERSARRGAYQLVECKSTKTRAGGAYS